MDPGGKQCYLALVDTPDPSAENSLGMGDGLSR